MNLRDLRYLVAVDEYRHFGRAAEACFVSQPTLSTQIRKLEQELGVELVERSPRRILLTETGARIVERAKAIIAETQTIENIALQARDPESGSLRMGLFPTLAPYLLPHVVPTIHDRFPKLELLLVEEKTEVLLARLRDGRLDVALLARPVHDTSLHEESLFFEDFVLAVPTGHPLASTSGPVEASVLRTEPVLLLEEGHCLRDQALSLCQASGGVERVGFRATSLETLRQMVAANVGITLLPELAIEPPVPPSSDIRTLRFAPPIPRREIAMYWRDTSVYAEVLPKLADVFRTVAKPLVGHSPGPKRAPVTA